MLQQATPTRRATRATLPRKSVGGMVQAAREALDDEAGTFRSLHPSPKRGGWRAERAGWGAFSLRRNPIGAPRAG